MKCHLAVVVPLRVTDGELVGRCAEKITASTVTDAMAYLQQEHNDILAAVWDVSASSCGIQPPLTEELARALTGGMPPDRIVLNLGGLLVDVDRQHLSQVWLEPEPDLVPLT